VDTEETEVEDTAEPGQQALLCYVGEDCDSSGCVLFYLNVFIDQVIGEAGIVDNNVEERLVGFWG